MYTLAILDTGFVEGENNNNNNKTLMNPDFQNVYYKYFKKYI